MPRSNLSQTMENGDVKSDFTEIYGICLLVSEKRVCLKTNQASSGSIQSRIAFQRMLPKS